MKAELLADMLRSDGYSVRYVVGYYVGMIPKFVRTKFMDVHFWIEVLTDNEWLVLDPSPDRFTALISGDTEPGTHLSEPRYISKMDELPPWFKDIYNDWSILAHKIILNIGLSVVRLLIKIGGAKNNGKSTNGSYGSNVWTGYDCGCS
jgi:transglutaminase-like putative cysteine protease